MQVRISFLASLLVITSAGLYAQVAGSEAVVGFGYALPKPRAVSPGQVISLFLRGAAAPGAPVVVSASPLPRELAGYSVLLEQTTAGAPIEVPLLGVSRTDACYGLLPCVPVAVLTLQIPWELRPNIASQGRPDNFATLRVTTPGGATEVHPLRPVRDAIHVLSTCEVSPVLQQAPAPVNPDGVCRSRVFHSDGSQVTAGNPAQPGETVLLQAVGFGVMEGRPASGSAADTDLPVDEVQMAVEFGPNRESRWWDDGTAPVATILRSGQFGIYEIAVTVPTDIPEGTPACTASRIQSNVTVSLRRFDSFSGASFCVRTADELQ